MWRSAGGKPEALEPIVKVLLRETAGDVHGAYCAAVHLAATSKVLRVRGVDIALRLVNTITGHAGEPADAADVW